MASTLFQDGIICVLARLGLRDSTMAARTCHAWYRASAVPGRRDVRVILTEPRRMDALVASPRRTLVTHLDVSWDTVSDCFALLAQVHMCTYVRNLRLPRLSSEPSHLPILPPLPPRLRKLAIRGRQRQLMSEAAAGTPENMFNQEQCVIINRLIANASRSCPHMSHVTIWHAPYDVDLAPLVACPIQCLKLEFCAFMEHRLYVNQVAAIQSLGGSLTSLVCDRKVLARWQDLETFHLPHLTEWDLNKPVCFSGQLGTTLRALPSLTDLELYRPDAEDAFHLDQLAHVRSLCVRLHSTCPRVSETLSRPDLGLMHLRRLNLYARGRASIDVHLAQLFESAPHLESVRFDIWPQHPFLAAPAVRRQLKSVTVMGGILPVDTFDDLLACDQLEELDVRVPSHQVFMSLALKFRAAIGAPTNEDDGDVASVRLKHLKFVRFGVNSVNAFTWCRDNPVAGIFVYAIDALIAPSYASLGLL